MTASLLDEVGVRRSLPPPQRRKAIREAAGVSQERLAQELDVHRVTVARWEHGSRSPRGELLARYVRLLDQLQAVAP